MFVAMNRFRVFEGKEEEFEDLWRNRESRLGEMEGFVSFHLLRGPTSEGRTLYASHTIWESEAAFKAWTTSAHFRATHRNVGKSAEQTGALYDGPPRFEGFRAVEGA
ncbi:antibiotic biosynthesis monooxygenase [Pikeienuella sp. HZG-20]|uniref:antibiotic biosynthesis monooxygenase family protein n=1 Tax=Paludibacillus litoralis TaxID=3133267 RepID=UPI0030EDCF1D